MTTPQIGTGRESRDSKEEGLQAEPTLAEIKATEKEFAHRKAHDLEQLMIADEQAKFGT